MAKFEFVWSSAVYRRLFNIIGFPVRVRKTNSNRDKWLVSSNLVSNCNFKPNYTKLHNLDKNCANHMIFIEKLLGQRAPLSNPYVFGDVRIFFYVQSVIPFLLPMLVRYGIALFRFLSTFLGILKRCKECRKPPKQWATNKCRRLLRKTGNKPHYVGGVQGFCLLVNVLKSGNGTKINP